MSLTGVVRTGISGMARRRRNHSREKKSAEAQVLREWLMAETESAILAFTKVCEPPPVCLSLPYL